MSKEEEKKNELKEAISNFVLGEVGGAEDISDVEENCGSMYITLKNGDVYSLSLMKCEN